MREVDVLVVGGGMAGLAASIAASAMGARTVLLERSHVLGGNVSQANVHSFCGLFESPDKENNFVYANPGFSSWFAKGMCQAGVAGSPEVHGRVAVMPIYPPLLDGYIKQLVARYPSLEVHLGARLSQLEMATSSTAKTTATYVQEGVQKNLFAKTVIDTSGDASAATLAGAQCDAVASETLQNATLIFSVAGANQTDLSGYSRLSLSARVARSAQHGELPQHCESIFVRPAKKDNEAYISLNLPKWPHQTFDPLNDIFMKAYTEHAHELAENLIQFLRAKVPGWSNCKLNSWPLKIGIRESRRILGQYVMTEEDVLTGAKRHDGVARSTWPIELWNNHYHASFQYPVSACDIPLSALVSQTHNNLGMAGRCMSATHEALGALRVLGTAMATGEAIGIAAAIAADRLIMIADVCPEELRIQRNKLMTKEFSQA